MTEVARHGGRGAWNWLRHRPNQSGQGMVEYALVLILVSLVVVAALLALGGQISNIFTNVVDKLKTA